MPEPGVQVATSTLLAPYFTLDRPGEGAPLHAWRPHLSWLRLRGAPAGAIQRTLPPHFRASFEREAGHGRDLAAHHPLTLDRELWTDAWSQLCDSVRHYKRLSSRQQAGTLGLLLSLGHFDLLLKLADFPRPEDIRADRHQAEIAGSHAACDLILALAGLRPFNPASLVCVARNAPAGSRVRFDAVMDLLALGGGNLPDLAWSSHWREVAQAELALHTRDAGRESVTAHLLASRFHRAASRVPLLRRDRAAVVAEMQRCEDHARAARPSDTVERVLCAENMLPMLQSRAKEARWLGDLDLAQCRLEEACAIDPADSLRWLELGELQGARGEWRSASDSYVRAAMLAPPGASLAWYMAGECERHAIDDLPAGPAMPRSGLTRLISLSAGLP